MHAGHVLKGELTLRLGEGRIAGCGHRKKRTMTTSHQLDEKEIQEAVAAWIELNGKIEDREVIKSVTISHGENDRGCGYYYTATVTIGKAK